jgi:hypothetical protein
VLRFSRFGLAGLIVASSFPLLAVALLIAVLRLPRFALLPRSNTRKGGAGIDLQRSWKADEFRFESAVASYEDLIDSFAWRRG